ncbi:MAG: glutamine-hydrolyzing carbamoyl-phosphate synthase small subunit [Methylophilaceae bacterium]|nr:glutamine-hydrolyzing carbamoyl-phosphate synthase small subunit [Methylophilaceae bacterium]
MSSKMPAILVLADGTKFRGYSIGIEGNASGEVVFNTAMTGYQEILTDPSYTEQLVTLTYPHIGNTGINSEDSESHKIFAKGLIIRDLPIIESNFRSSCSLSDFLVSEKIIAIAGIDTRQLTKHIRMHGAQPGCIAAGIFDEKDIARNANEFPGLSGMDLAKVVTTDKEYLFNEGEWVLGSGFESIKNTSYNVVAYDYGVKKNILRMLASRGCRVNVVPANMPANEVLALKPDGIFLSNGPGDPEPCDYAIKNIQTLINGKIPIFGICLGHQLLGLASHAKTHKMKFGHHGANHPVQDLETGKVFITSQNHGFAVDEKTLPANLKATHRSLFDGSLQGISRTDSPAYSFQGHPEASPGPTEMSYLFDKFINMMIKAKKK